jgi:hypothetical protein
MSTGKLILNHDFILIKKQQLHNPGCELPLSYLIEKGEIHTFLSDEGNEFIE